MCRPLNIDNLLLYTIIFLHTRSEYFTFFTRFNRAYLVNPYKIKLVDPWVRYKRGQLILQSIGCNGRHATWLLKGSHKNVTK